MVLGDVHGNADWLRLYVYPRAMVLGVDLIVQLGDFGYWEHTPAGVKFLKEASDIATVAGIPLYWLRGNHDKTSFLFERYSELGDDDGFLYIRDNIFFIPDGTLWTWQGRSFRAFGGAYSVDKNWRVQQEALNYAHLVRKEQYRAEAQDRAPEPVPSQAGQLWFPEEEMRDVDMDAYLAAFTGRVDYVFSHDKPRCTNPGWNRKDLPLCLPNQDRLQRALLAHTPSYWFHGHLHYHYLQDARSGPDSVTTVVSLEPDDNAAEVGWKRHNTWCLIELDGDTGESVVLGKDARPRLDQVEVNAARDLLTRL